MNVEISFEYKRNCGYRKPSADGVGIYLVGDALFFSCYRLPFPLTVCPCCSGGIKPSRGFTWIDPTRLFAPELEPKPTCLRPCIVCQPDLVGKRAGLMWVGNKYYSPSSFVHEARYMGVSKRIPAVPNGFEFGKHVVFLAHRHAVACWDNAKNQAKPGVFMAFMPRRVDLVIDDLDYIPKRAEFYKKKYGDNARIIKVKPVTNVQMGMGLNGNKKDPL